MANGVVYFGSYDHNVYALSTHTGGLLWSYTTGNLVQPSPAVANGVVYVGSWYYPGNNLFALDATTGAELWTYSTGIYVWCSPTVANGMVYVGSDTGYLYAFGLPSGGS